MRPQEKARLLRPLIEKASASLPDEEALEAVELFPKWDGNGVWVEKGERRRYEGELYRCEQSHYTQMDWTPDMTKSLWTAVAEPGTIPVWKQPTGAQDAYRLNDLVHFPTETDPVYISTIDYNIYAPDVAGWDFYSSK